MNRFILYSGLVHCALFVGALGYVATQSQDAENPSVESLVELELPTAATRDVAPATENTSSVDSEGPSTRNDEPALGANKTEVRERKVRASLPSSPAVPRIVERVEKVIGEKLPTTLPEKVKPSQNMVEAPKPSEGEKAPVTTEESPAFATVESEALPNPNEDPSLSELDALAAKHLEELKRGEEGDGESESSSDEDAMKNSGATRALKEFKQQAGNKKPLYDNKDRLEGRQGLVVFKAFVTKTGDTKDFQIVTSSGHRALDLKTLAALRAWKFEPGQEGWVELPFRWDLKGGVEEAPSMLRRLERTAQ